MFGAPIGVVVLACCALAAAAVLLPAPVGASLGNQVHPKRGESCPAKCAVQAVVVVLGGFVLREELQVCCDLVGGVDGHFLDASAASVISDGARPARRSIQI